MDTLTTPNSTIPSDECLDFCQIGRNTLEIEIEALQSIAQGLDEHFRRACQLLLQTQGKIIVMGIGKSGHIASKIAATLASTGSPAFFIHPAEARHGDLGMVSNKDTLLILSSSGETEEVIMLLPAFKRMGSVIISLTGNKHSTVALAANVNLDVSVKREACPLNLAPTASTTAALAMGDAIAVALLKARGFTSEKFALSHPGGALGRRLLLKAHDLMRTGDAVPRVFPETTLSEALIEITNKRLGMTAIISKEGQTLGIFTDGDLRRTLEKISTIHTITMRDIMTPTCKTIRPSLLAAEALHIMESNKITSLLVADENNSLLGVLHMHDLLERGLS